MKTALLVLAALLLPATAHADRKWSGVDTGLEIAAVSLLVVDYIQTTEIVADGMEGNPMVRATSPGIYFASAALIHVAASVALPQPYRRIFQGVTIGIQADTIHTNWQAGYGIRF